MPDFVGLRRSTGWAVVALMLVVGLVGAVRYGASAQSPSSGGSTTGSLQVVPTMRSMTVSSVATIFSDCTGGAAPFPSTATALGYPNGRCSIGRSGSSLPITIKNGVPAEIFVQATNAIPSDRGIGWRLCNLGPVPAVACTGRGGLPGVDQFVMENFSSAGRNHTGLTAANVCDAEFSASGCLASNGQSQHEGILLIGPEKSVNSSLSWTVTVTWVAVPP